MYNQYPYQVIIHVENIVVVVVVSASIIRILQ